ncbi:glycosyltransferase family 4 protein [Halogeometricum borinquense]|uniref:glycosyltransferase family 4 protein n=1 Tax=Halogeometricum borinquense TaxID=60847 RepID=UPI00342B562D
MHISHPASEKHLEGGIKTSIQNQREAFEKQGISYTPRFSRDADILHLNVPTPRTYVQLRRAKRAGIPVVMHTHEIGENFQESFRLSTTFSPIVRRYVDFFYKRADHLIAPSEYAKRVLKQRGLNTPISVVTNGIDPDRLAGVYTGEYSPKSTIERNGEQESRLTVANASILFERKGLSDFTAVARQLQDVNFAWFGPRFNRFLTGSSVDKTIQRAPNNCVFPGFADDVRDVYAASDVFFFPTKSETEGISIIEAAYCGIPIVTRDIPVYEPLLEHGTHCLKGSSVEEFKNHIKLLQNDPELRKRLGENARELAEQFTIGAVGKELEIVYQTTV